MTLVSYKNDRGFGPPQITGFLNKFDFLENLFEDSEFDNNQMKVFSPSVDVLESDKAYELHFSVPGFDKNSLHIDVEKTILSVSGERTLKESKENKKYTSVQSQYGSFRKAFTLPDTVDSTKIDAQYQEGLLKITLPKDKVKAIKNTVKIQ